MPRRHVPLVTGELYHLLNRGTGSIPIFKSGRNYIKFLETLLYYRWDKTPFSFSKFLALSKKGRAKLKSCLEKENDPVIKIVSFCLMPTHFHLLVEQIKGGGILKLMQSIQNSYSHYFNKKNDRKGGLFESTFKAVRVETEPQLLHLSRYIHLNPYSSCLVKDFSALVKYPYSSLPEYLGLTKTNICHKNSVLNHFPSKKDYKEFLLNHADHQQALESIKHQLLE